MTPFATLKTELAADFARLGAFKTLHTLGVKYSRSGNIAFISCPWHAEKTPSCAVAVGEQGTLRAHCHACGKTCDVHALVGQVNGIDVRTAFRDVLSLEADILGRFDVIDGLRGVGAPREPRPLPPLPEPAPESTYPDTDTVFGLIQECVLTHQDIEVSTWLRSRGLDADAVDVRGLAYALPASCHALPPWARFGGRPWTETGHRLIVPLFDCQGRLTSVRAGRVIEGDTPKRLTPAGCKARGLVMADAMGQEVLRSGEWPSWAGATAQVVIAEGEPDFVSAALQTPLYQIPNSAVFGIYSSSWCSGIAERMPSGASVAVWTDADEPGERYATHIAATLAGRCHVVRGVVQP